MVDLTRVIRLYNMYNIGVIMYSKGLHCYISVIQSSTYWPIIMSIISLLI